MLQSDKVSFRQLMICIVLGLFSPAVRILPSFTVTIAGNAAWVAPIAAIVPTIIYMLILTSFIKYRHDGENLSHMFMRSIGTIPGKLILAVYIIWLIFYSSFILRTAAERLMSSVYDNGTEGIFLVITIIVSAIAASGKTKALFRTAEVFLPIIVTVIAVVLILAISEMKPQNLLPVSYLDTTPILIAVLPIINIICISEYYMFLSGDIAPSGREWAVGVKWIMLSLAIIFAESVFTIGTLSAELTDKIQNPFFIMIRNIKTLGVAERIESIVLGLWVVTDFLFLGALIMIIAQLGKDVCNTQSRKGFVWPVTIIILTISIFISPDAFTLKKMSIELIPTVNMFFGFIILPFIFIIGKLRKKI